MIIDLVVGARPNFVKAAAILHAAEKHTNLKINLVHTGQHKDIMSDQYFKDLQLPEPESYDPGGYDGYTMPQRLGGMIQFLSRQFAGHEPNVVMVVGDTDSTLAGALAAVKMGIPAAHVEAGLRCGDLKMQEEVNRILVDSISTYHYATSEWAVDNLSKEGHWRGVKLVGNVMIDSLIRFLPEAYKRYPTGGYGKPYGLLTLHRAENVDDDYTREILLGIANEVATKIPVLWCGHPRCKADQPLEHLTRTGPLGYLQFISLLAHAKFVMTDSGGVQEESTALGIPCITLRDRTERPETVHQGTNTVAGRNSHIIYDIVRKALDPTYTTITKRPPLWDGHAAERILEDLCATL